MNVKSRLGLVALLSSSLLALAAPLAVAQTAPATYAVTDHIKIPDGGYDYASFDPVMRRVYLARTGAVTAVEVDTKTVLGHLADVQHGHAVLPLNDGAVLLVTDSGSGTARMVDAVSGKLLADIPAGQKPDGATFDPVSGLALSIDGHGGQLILIDPIAKTPVGAISVGGGLEFAVADGAGRVFDNVEDQNRIAVIDVKSRAVVGSYSLKGCEGPTGLAYAGDAGVLIAACANKVAKVIRAADGVDLATLAIGLGPDTVLYDPARRLAFIPCGRDGILEVIAVRSASDVSVVQTLKTLPGARTGALDPKTGKVYLPTARFVAPAPGAKPVATPGTYEFLVVSPAAAN